MNVDGMAGYLALLKNMVSFLEQMFEMVMHDWNSLLPVEAVCGITRKDTRKDTSWLVF